MLHRIQKPDCLPQLVQICQFQRDVLAMACAEQTALPLTEQGVLTALGENRGQWLWGKLWKQQDEQDKTTFHTALVQVVEHIGEHPESRQAILNAFDNDFAFYQSLDDASFRFQFSSLSNDTQTALKSLMVSFYNDLLSGGFDASIHGHHLRLNRDGFIEAFWRVNEKNLEVCPACDKRRSDKVDNKVYDDADHYLPKSKYPFLSLHFANLVPLCIYCNRSFKGDRDPIDNQDDAPLVNMFHPYERPALECVDVVISRDGNGVHQAEFEDKEGMPSRRVQSLQRVFRLNERWIDELRHQIEVIRDSIAENPKIWLSDQNDDRTPQDLRLALETMLELRSRKLGKRAGYILQTSYLAFVLNDNDEFEVLLGYFLDDLTASSTPIY